MRRREFVAGIGSVLAVRPPTALAQQAAVPLVGFIRITPLSATTHILNAFREGMKHVGYLDRQDVEIEYRTLQGSENERSALVAEFVRRNAALIMGDTPSALAAKASGMTLPIVFATGSDPVRDGLVANLNRPGGNVTGVVFFNAVLGAKRFELLRQLVPGAATIAMLVNPNTANTEVERKETQRAAQAIGKQLIVFDVSSEHDIESAFTALVQRRAGALFVGTGGFLNAQRERLVSLAARHAIPAIYAQREATLAGGLMSYGTSLTDAYHQAGTYAGRILKGEKPGDLPVMQSSKFEFVINLKTAKTLGLEFHPQLLAIADEVIE
jgi:putative tryptophan/tyrosine transport system substrate-binding protein